jgi:hypothetical protein
MRYVVELKDEEPNEWALDTVTMDEADEFSQLHLDELITSSRELTREQVLELVREDEGTAYLVGSWSDEDFMDRLVTKHKPE